ncbi:MAG: hypothetical protein A2V85_03765 [Chloroflexi bacterium RBG_16_72_14]|nr:MAG: hypothetical protein A2V85_03765 [Chloroflexi bacterium RBG_16_72_14]
MAVTAYRGVGPQRRRLPAALLGGFLRLQARWNQSALGAGLFSLISAMFGAMVGGFVGMWLTLGLMAR